MKRGTRVLLGAVGTAAALMLAAQFALPPVVRGYINDHGEELLGRRVSVGHLGINVLTAGVTARDVVVYEADGSTEFIGCGALRTRVKLPSLLARRLVVARLSLDNLRASAVQNGDSFNWDDIAERFADTSGEETEPSSWDVGVFNISLRDAELSYRDLATGGDWQLRRLTLDVPGFMLSGRAATDAGLNFDFPDGGTLSSKIVYDHPRGTYDLELSLRDFNVEGFLPYIERYLDVRSVEGSLSGDVRVIGRSDSAMDLQVSGTVVLRRFALTDGERGEVLVADSVVADIRQIDPERGVCLLRRLSVHGPRADYHIYPDSTDRLSRLLKPSAEEAAAPVDGLPVPPPPKMHVEIGELSVTGGTVEFTDETPGETFRYTIGDISLLSSDFSPDGYCTATVEAALPGAGKARAKWSGNPSGTSYHALTLRLSNIAVADFSPYTLAMFGYPFTSGTLSIGGRGEVRDGKLSGNGTVDLFRPETGKRRRGVKPQYRVPLRTGMYILTDRSGRMLMDIPLSGEVDSPQFAWGRIIPSAIGNTLVKVVASPAAYIASAMGLGGEEDLGSVPVEPLQREFTSEQYDRLGRLARTLREKPQLKLTMTWRAELERTLAEEALAQLRVAGYLRANPAKADLESDELEELASYMDQGQRQLSALADSLLAAAGKKPSGDLVSRAKALYGKRAEERMAERMAARDALLAGYLQKSGLADTTFRIVPATTAQMRRYRGKPHYEVEIALSGEEEED